MGWLREEHPDHEGYVIGFVPREECDLGSGLYRELMYPLDATTRRVELLAGGCDCGWRSPRWSPKTPADWGPWSVFASEEDDERAMQLWRRHLALDVGGDRGGDVAQLAGPGGSDRG